MEESREGGITVNEIKKKKDMVRGNIINVKER
jgi:hypothetical protein